MDHVVNLNAVYELSVVSEFGLDSVKLGIKLLKIGERSKVNTLNIAAQMFILEQKVDDFKSL